MTKWRVLFAGRIVATNFDDLTQARRWAAKFRRERAGYFTEGGSLAFERYDDEEKR